ncbi:MAG TPA: DUF4347 domain-containing protein [Burkholderiaceae bacterium]|jgi:hypothetical protein|nr:DUF4347 domain-containing protein [Burkholderiaceae bacterium]
MTCDLRASPLPTCVSAASASAPTHAALRDLLIADGGRREICDLVRESRLPRALIGPSSHPLQVIATLMAGESIDTLHLVGHGRAGAMSLGGTFIDTATLLAERDTLASWPVRRIALWGCSVGAESEFPATLARLTGATVICADAALGRHADRPRWSLNRCFDADGEQADESFLDARFAAAGAFEASTLAI